MRSKHKTGASTSSNSTDTPQSQLCFEGESLSRFLKSIQMEIESARAADTALPIKFWIKQQFAVGVNEVTRTLERMPPNYVTNGANSKAPCIYLQAILIASDCNPRWLTKHLPALAASRNVPLIFLKDGKEGSLRLGELVKLKTAIAIGIKDKGNAVNQVIKEVLVGDKIGKHCGLGALFGFVITALLVVFNYAISFGSALDTFNTAVVSPIYYAMFTSLTILASAIMFKDWYGQSASNIISVLCGFITVLSGTMVLHCIRDPEKLPSTDYSALSQISWIVHANGEIWKQKDNDDLHSEYVALIHQDHFR